MATSGELIKVVANVLGIAEATATTYYRSLREVGLVTKAGRGPSAARMTARDAAYLLIAAGGSRFEKQPAERVVRTFDRVEAFNSAHTTRLPIDGKPGFMGGDWIEGDGSWAFEGLNLPRLQALPPRHRLSDALVALIETIMESGFSAAIDTRFPGSLPAFLIEIFLYGPEPRADIEIDIWKSDGGYGCREEAGYRLSEWIDMSSETHASLEQRMMREYGDGDLEIRRRITHKTLIAVANLLNDHAHDER